MADLVPLLSHLTPPYAAAKIRTDRFSPNYDSAQELGFKELWPILRTLVFMISLRTQSIIWLSLYIRIRGTSAA